MKTEDLLLGLGYNRIAAKILYSLMTNESITVNNLEKSTGVTKSRIYQVLNEFIRKGMIYTSKNWPKEYSVTKSTIDSIKEQINSLAEKLVTEIKTEKTTNFKIKIKEALQKKGFKIEDFPTHNLRMPFLIQSKNIFSFIACDNKYIRLSCIVIDKTNEEYFDSILADLPPEIVIEEIISSSIRVGCLVPFIFIDPQISNQKIVENIKDGLKEYLTSPLVQNKGFEGEPIFVSATEDIDNNILNVIKKIKERRQIISEIENNLRKLLTEIDERLSSIDTASSVSKLFLSSKDQKKMDIIKESVEEIVQREKRNKNLVKQGYIFGYVKIMQILKQIDEHLFLPIPEEFIKEKNNMENINKKLDPIIFELQSLHQEILGYIFANKKVNPFLFTVPTKTDNFVANQETIKASFKNLCLQIPETTLPLIRLIKGPEGIGKSHLLKNCLNKFAEENKLFFIYTSCQLNKDFIEDTSKQIIEYLRKLSSIKAESIINRYSYKLPNDPDEFTLLIIEMQKIINEAKYSGIVLAIDEFENAIEASISSSFHIIHLREIINKPISGLGIVISCRNDKFDELKKTLGEYNITHATDEVKTMQKSHIKEMINNRCASWNQEECLNLPDDIIDLIIQKTNSNTRDIIKYLREIYHLALTKKPLTKADVEKIQLPIFKIADNS